MRTTVSIDDELLRAAKDAARRSGRRLGDVIDEALRQNLLTDRGRPSGPAVPVVRGGLGASPDLDLTSNRSLIAAMDSGVDAERLR